MSVGATAVMPIAVLAKEPEFLDSSADIEPALEIDPLLQAFASHKLPQLRKVEARLDDGIAYLSGTLDSYYDRCLAGQFAMHFDGVKRVKDEIQVVYPERKDSPFDWEIPA